MFEKYCRDAVTCLREQDVSKIQIKSKSEKGRDRLRVK